jgi:hypothetical protein
VVTTAANGLAAVAVRRLGEIGHTTDPAEELVVSLRGGLPRAPDRGECIALAATVVRDFKGYQLKSHMLVDPAFASRLHGKGPAGAIVRTPRVFTIHHGPQTANFFEKIPYADVAASASAAGYALVAVGEQANISPRWIVHHEVRDGALELFHGDACWSKTYLNVRRNPGEVRLVLDLDQGAGYALEGEQREFWPDEHPVVAGKVSAMFARAGIEQLARLSSLRVARIRKIAPEA